MLASRFIPDNPEVQSLFQRHSIAVGHSKHHRNVCVIVGLFLNYFYISIQKAKKSIENLNAYKTFCMSN